MPALSSIAIALQLLGLALMTGGMLALGAFTAPVVFGGLEREVAGGLMTTIFRRYDTVILVSAALVVAGEVIRFFSTGSSPFSQGLLNSVRIGILVATLVLVFYSLFSINPKMEALQQAGLKQEKAQEFQTLHKTSEKLYKLEMAGALILLLLIPFTLPLPKP